MVQCVRTTSCCRGILPCFHPARVTALILHRMTDTAVASDAEAQLTTSPYVPCSARAECMQVHGLRTHFQGRKGMHMDVWGASFGRLKQSQVCLPCTSTDVRTAQRPYQHRSHQPSMWVVQPYFTLRTVYRRVHTSRHGLFRGRCTLAHRSLTDECAKLGWYA